jgi:hypothetical protein
VVVEGSWRLRKMFHTTASATGAECDACGAPFTNGECQVLKSLVSLDLAEIHCPYCGCRSILPVCDPVGDVELPF